MTIHKPWEPQAAIEFSHQKSSRQPKDLVSVCVTNFNYARFLPDCLNSLASQTHKNLDLVIVDDASTVDDSIEVAVEWLKVNATRFYRTILFRHTRNQGPSEARNTAFRHALSEHVFVIDADNEAYPRTIARLRSAMLSGDFDAVYPQLEIFGNSSGIGLADIWDAATMYQSNYVDVTGIVLRSAWERVGGYSHIDQGWEDYDFWLKFIDADLSAAYVPEILCRYRTHGKSRTTTEAHAAHEQLKVIMALRHPPPEDAPKEAFATTGIDAAVKKNGSVGTASLFEAPRQGGKLRQSEAPRSKRESSRN